MKLNDIFRFLCIAKQAAGVGRFHTVRTITQNRVDGHSWGVAVLCDIICGGKPDAYLLRAALYHDLAEVDTGDIPATAKWSSEELAGYVKGREKFFSDHLERFNISPYLNDQEKLVLKWADSLDGMFYCWEEKNLGNRFMDHTFWNWVEYLKAIECPNEIAKSIFDSLVTSYSSGDSIWPRHHWSDYVKSQLGQ
jgi:5'-deoxynucleotidase YfbR-like HD superfamily hydrolase